MATERWEARDDGDDGIPYVMQVEPDVMGDIVCVAPTEYMMSMAQWARRAPLLAAAPDLLAVAGGLMILGDNAHNMQDDPVGFREFFDAVVEDARAVYAKATAAPDGGTGDGPG